MWLHSCIITDYSHLRNNGQVELSGDELPKVFGQEFSSAVYNTSVEAYGHHFSGLLAIKRMDGKAYRTILTTKFGTKLFDFEFTENGQFIVHQCVEELNRARFIEVFRKDMELIFMRNTVPAQTKKLRPKGNGSTVYRIKTDRGRQFYYVNQTEHMLQRIEHAQFFRGKRVKIELSGADDVQPQLILINHLRRPLQIELHQMQTQN